MSPTPEEVTSEPEASRLVSSRAEGELEMSPGGDKGDIVIPDHMTGKREKDNSELPEVPDCPGPQALNADEILERPKPTEYFTKKFPNLARTYNKVVSRGLPNYRGAMVKLDSKLKIKEWEKNKINSRINH